MGDWAGIQPSLRDVCNRSTQPSSELLGYYRFSLRETGTAPPSESEAEVAVSRRGDRSHHLPRGGGDRHLPEGDSIIAHPFKGGMRCMECQVPKGRLNQPHKDRWSKSMLWFLCAECTVKICFGVGHREGVQPSLRDVCNRSTQPSSELLGYYRFSLRETGTAPAPGSEA